jgi:lipid II:glycine glycyltransferase (peptidoglycan interpeptide bridge formation enzyme)
MQAELSLLREKMRVFGDRSKMYVTNKIRKETEMKVTNSIDAYQSFLDKSDQGNLFQTKIFYEILRKIRWNPLALTVMENNDCVGGLLAYLPLNVHFPKSFYPMAVVLDGPIALNSTALSVLMDSLDEEIRKLGVTKIEIIAPFPCDHRVFLKRNYVLQHTGGEYSITIDLDNSIDKLWSEVKRGCRKRIKKALKMGVEVKEVESEEQLKEFYTVYLDTSKRRGFLPIQYSLFEEMWKYSLKNKIAQFLTAVYKGKTIAGRINTAYLGKVNTFKSFSFDQSWNLNPNHLFMWGSICRSKEEKAKSFNIFYLPDKKEIDQKGDYYTFKTSFGGKMLRNRAFYYKIPSPLRYQVLTVASRLLRPAFFYQKSSVFK